MAPSLLLSRSLSCARAVSQRAQHPSIANIYSEDTCTGHASQVRAACQLEVWRVNCAPRTCPERHVAHGDDDVYYYNSDRLRPGGTRKDMSHTAHSPSLITPYALLHTSLGGHNQETAVAALLVPRSSRRRSNAPQDARPHARR